MILKTTIVADEVKTNVTSKLTELEAYQKKNIDRISVTMPHVAERMREYEKYKIKPTSRRLSLEEIKIINAQTKEYKAWDDGMIFNGDYYDITEDSQVVPQNQSDAKGQLEKMKHEDEIKREQIKCALFTRVLTDIVGLKYILKYDSNSNNIIEMSEYKTLESAAIKEKNVKIIRLINIYDIYQKGCLETNEISNIIIDYGSGKLTAGEIKTWGK